MVRTFGSAIAALASLLAVGGCMGRLQQSASEGDTAAVARYLDSGTDVDQQQRRRSGTALHWAAYDGHIDLVRMLLEKGAAIDSRDKNEWTPLHWATMANQKEVIEILIDRGANINALDDNDYSSLDLATWGKLEDIARLLQSRGGKFGKYVLVGTLHDAVKEGERAEVIKFLRARVGTNEKDSLERTPLHWAAFKGRAEIAELLIFNRADVNARDREGMTPLDLANEERHESLVDLISSLGGRTGEELAAAGFILDKPRGNSASIWEAAATGDQYGLEDFLVRGIDINARNTADEQDQMTPLHYAVKHGQTRGVELLLKKGADITIADSLGRTNLHMLCDVISEDMNSKPDEKEPKIPISDRRATIANWLIFAGANMDVKDNRGDTPLHLAVRNGNTPMASLLLAKGANSLIRDAEGRTPFDLTTKKEVTEKLLRSKKAYVTLKAEITISQALSSSLREAAMKGSRADVQRYLASGADIDSRDEESGLTPLHHAVRGGHRHIVKLLLKEGADPNPASAEGWTPLHIAAFRGNLDIAKQLIGVDCNINAMVQHKWTALDLSEQQGHGNLADLILQAGGNRGNSGNNKDE